MITLRPSLGSFGNSNVWIRSSSVATRASDSSTSWRMSSRSSPDVSVSISRPVVTSSRAAVSSCQARTISPSSLWRRDRSRRRSWSERVAGSASSVSTASYSVWSAAIRSSNMRFRGFS